MNKNCIALAILIPFALFTQEPPQDPTVQYRTKKADLAIIHDKYQEAEAYTDEWPDAWKEAITQFGFKFNDINFYTAVRTNRFVEKVGNNIVLLRPNFFLYLTDTEQATYIGLELARLKAGDPDILEGSHTTQKKNSVWYSLNKKIIGAAGLALGCLHFGTIKTLLPNMIATSKNLLFSKSGAVVSIALLTHLALAAAKQRKQIQKVYKHEYAVIDNLGAEGLLTIREKQTQWGYNNCSWLTNQWYKLLGKLSLKYNPESSLERLKKYVESKK